MNYFVMSIVFVCIILKGLQACLNEVPPWLWNANQKKKKSLLMTEMIVKTYLPIRHVGD